LGYPAAVLTAQTFGPADAELTVVLLHGFGAAGDDLVPLGAMLARLAGPTRFVFPAAPIALGGMYGEGRAWWPLDLVKLEAELRAGTLRDRRSEVPDGLPAARAAMIELLEALSPRGKVVLGGFSQGAMLALDVALRRDPTPGGLVLMSGTMLAEAEWLPRMAKLAGVPIAMSHGRQDPLLPFAIADELRGKLIAAGARVDWHPFVGGHEIPPPVLAAVGQFLKSLA
jgi:phospholipase/carboxylesterase